MAGVLGCPLVLSSVRRPRSERNIVHAERVQRRLAAILAAEVARYSRLMGAEEEGTLAQLKAHRRELIDPKITEHHSFVFFCPS